MAVQDITLPEIGQGLREATVVALLKDVGEAVARDEPLYEVETSKADIVIESPTAGTIVGWQVAAGEEVPVGGVVVRLEVAEPSLLIPPRTRAYAAEQGLADEDLAGIVAAGRRLLPADIDRHLAAQPDSGNVDRVLDERQRGFIGQLRQTQQTAIPASVRHPLDWTPVRAVAARYRGKASEFHVLAWCVARAAAEHRLFRSALIDDRTVREAAHVNLGIGVEIDQEGLAVTVVEAADRLSPADFVRTAREQVKAALRGAKSSGAHPHLLLSYLPRRSVMDAVPVLVAPAVATLFVGKPMPRDGALLAQATLTFDHRLINGGPAARFLRTVADQVASAEGMGESWDQEP